MMMRTTNSLRKKEPGNDEIVLISPASDTEFEYAAELRKNHS